jgi:hypothetical protein
MNIITYEYNNAIHSSLTRLLGFKMTPAVASRDINLQKEILYATELNNTARKM